MLKRLQRRHGLDLAGLIERRDALRLRLGDGGFAADLDRLRQQHGLASVCLAILNASEFHYIR